MKKYIFVCFIALCIFNFTGCISANNNLIDKEENNYIEEKDNIQGDESRDIENTKENITEDIKEDITGDIKEEIKDGESLEEDRHSEAIKPKHSGEGLEIDLDKYSNILPLTEEWDLYHEAEANIEKKIAELDGLIFSDSVFFYDYKDYYLAIVSEKDNFSATFIGLLDKGDLKPRFVERFMFSFNSAKEEVLIKDDEIILLTQFPFSAYSLFGKFIYEDEKIIYDSLVDYDSSIAYYTEFMELLNEGNMKGAMELEDYSSYPFAYEDLYFKSANLAIKKSLEFAKVAIKKGDYEKARGLLEWGLGLYFEKHYNFTYDLANISFEGVYLKETSDFGFEYLMSNDFIFEYMDLYLVVYREAGPKGDSQVEIEDLILEIKRLKDILENKEVKAENQQ